MGTIEINVFIQGHQRDFACNKVKYLLHILKQRGVMKKHSREYRISSVYRGVS
jgi:hypothetical protein